MAYFGAKTKLFRLLRQLTQLRHYFLTLMSSATYNFAVPLNVLPHFLGSHNALRNPPPQFFLKPDLRKAARGAPS